MPYEIKHYAALKTLLKTGWQRQDSVMQQLLDVQPVLQAAGLNVISDYILSFDDLSRFGLTCSNVYADEAKNITAVALPTPRSVALQKRMAVDISNLLGCYDASDIIKLIAEPSEQGAAS